ncbi:MAG: glycosyltransferase [Nitrospirota bacterium]
MDEPLISIIIPVKNEAELLKKCLESIDALDYPKKKIEVIVPDGLSTDGASEIAKQYGAEVILNKKQTVSPGRNIGFKISKGELIAFTDADCIVDGMWLKNAVKYFRDENVACVGGPNLTPPEEGNFSKAVGFVFGQRIFAAGSVHARVLNEIKEVKSIPGCNAIYRKEALDKVMPIDESLLTCDDTELNRRLLDEGYKLLYTPDVFVWHHRRPDARRLWKQMYRYAIGRLQAGKRDRRMINIIHVLAGLGIPVILLIALFSPFLLLMLSAASFVFMIFTSAYALMRLKSLPIALTVPVVITIMFFAWSAGFLRELLFPLEDTSGE